LRQRGSPRTARGAAEPSTQAILSNLETLLETSETLPLPSEMTVDHEAHLALRDS
jgi:hypothetical protein